MRIERPRDEVARAGDDWPYTFPDRETDADHPGLRFKFAEEPLPFGWVGPSMISFGLGILAALVVWEP